MRLLQLYVKIQSRKCPPRENQEGNCAIYNIFNSLPKKKLRMHKKDTSAVEGLRQIVKTW